MAASKKYVARSAPTANVRLWMDGEFRNVALSISTIVELLGALDVPIVVGANDSAGAGFRTLKIPNA